MSLMIVIIVIKGTIYMSLTTEQQGLSLFQTEASKKMKNQRKSSLKNGPIKTNKDQ